MLFLVLNCGGSSMKYQLLNMETEQVVVKGSIDRLGTEQARLIHQGQDGQRIERPAADIADFAAGIRFLAAELTKEGIVRGLEQIDAFVHKLAHGGEAFKEPVVIDDVVLEAMREVAVLAPVHNPPAIKGIEVCRRMVPDVPQIGVFETAFHQSVPAAHYVYGVPYKWYERYGVRKYGFHGASHGYVSARAAELLGRDDLKIVSCHLGSGTSVAAIDSGRSVDISSGFTPQSGTIMSTRPGDFDPWVIPFMSEKEGLSATELGDILVKEGGLLGISGVSGDMRDLREAAASGNKRAQLAIEVFAYQIKKYIGAFAAIMNGLDVLIFTGGIGENDRSLRAEVAGSLSYLGISLDEQRNKDADGEAVISQENGAVTVMVIPTNEELRVARQAVPVLRALRS